MKAGPLFFGSACERMDAAGSCCGLQRPDLGVPQRAKSMSWTGLPGAAEVWNSGRVSKEDFCGRKGRTRGSQPGVGRGLLQKKKKNLIKNTCHIMQVLFWASGSTQEPVGSAFTFWQRLDKTSPTGSAVQSDGVCPTSLKLNLTAFNIFLF